MTDDEAREHSGAEEIERSVLELENLKQQRDEIKKEIADIEEYLDKTVEKSYTVDDGDDRVVATVVRGYTDKFMEHLIETRYPKVWTVITRRVVDPKLYKDAIRVGTISEEMHMQFMVSVPKKTYVLTSRISPEDK